MPYSGPDDASLPDAVKKLPEKDRRQWVAIWNSTYEDCVDDGGEADECEAKAFRNANGVVMNRQLKFTANQIASTSRTRVDGTEYLVAPIVLIKEGVLNGELVPASEFARHYESWNGRPFVVDHPRDNEGNDISANHPLILAGEDPNVSGGLKIGELYNTEPYDHRLRSEIWIPIEQTRKKGGVALEVLEHLESKKKLEVSSAYWRDFDPSPGEWNGKEYAGVAMNLKPDHVAGLPNTVGACSWEDGCGAPRVNEEEGDMKLNVLSKSRRPKYSGTNTGSWSAPNLEDFGFDVSSVDELSAEQKRTIASKSLLGDPDADDFRNLSFFPVVHPSNNDLYEHALDAVISGRGAQADIPAEAKKSAQNMARRLLKEEFDRDVETEQARNNLLSYLSVLADFARTYISNEKEEVQKVSERERLIKELLANSEIGEEDLEGMSDCGLKALAAVILPEEEEEEPETNEEPEVETVDVETEEEGDEPEYVVKGELEQLFDKMVKRMDALETELHKDESQRHNELVKALAANERCAISEDKLMAMDMETLEGLQQSLVPPDYRGAGGGPESNDERELVIYDRNVLEVKNG